jgi:hypothetical protein
MSGSNVEIHAAAKGNFPGCSDLAREPRMRVEHVCLAVANKLTNALARILLDQQTMDHDEGVGRLGSSSDRRNVVGAARSPRQLKL